MLNYMALIVAIGLSSVAGVISVYGLIAIFAANPWAVGIVGGSLELAKVIAATWLHHHWKETTNSIKVYLTTAVAILMLITSMGIYGFFSKAHIDQQVTHSQNTSVLDLSKVETEIKGLQIKISNLSDQEKLLIPQVAALAKSITEKTAVEGQTKTTRNELQKSRDELKKLRDELTKVTSDKAKANADITRLETQKVGLNAETKKLEAEVGPIKYVAAWFSDKPGTEQLEAAVRWMILLLVFVFDPLAIALIVAASRSITLNKKPVTVVANWQAPLEPAKILTKTEEPPPKRKVMPRKKIKAIERRKKREKIKRKKWKEKQVRDSSLTLTKPIVDLTNAKL